MIRRRRQGQSATEYMLAISVIVIAVVAAALPFHERLTGGVQKFGQKFETYYAQPDERTP